MANLHFFAMGVGRGTLQPSNVDRNQGEQNAKHIGFGDQFHVRPLRGQVYLSCLGLQQLEASSIGYFGLASEGYIGRLFQAAFGRSCCISSLALMLVPGLIWETGRLGAHAGQAGWAGQAGQAVCAHYFA